MNKQTIDTYNKMAQQYDEETVSFWSEFPSEFMKQFVDTLGKNKKILDIGSGPGRDGLLLKQYDLDVMCLDASSSMVKFCLERGLNAVRGDFNKLAFPDNSYGGVWAYTSLLHTKRDEIIKPLSEIYRVLTNDGVLALGMIQGDSEGYRLSAGVDKPRWFTYYSIQELQELLINQGFIVNHFKTHHPGKSTYLHFICTK